MGYVFFSVLCSVAVSVVLKTANRLGYRHLDLIVWNYPVAVLATFFFLRPEIPDLAKVHLPWGLYLPLALLLPVVFVCIAYAIAFGGIVRTEVAQRLSLFIPLLAAFFIFREDIGLPKLVGIGVGLLAIVFSIAWGKKSAPADGNRNWIYPLAVFVGMGVIDILFKKVALYGGASYAFSMFAVFVLAMPVAFGLLAYRLWTTGEKPRPKSILWGILLGLFNFGNILLYMKAHRALPDSPSVVFTAMNIGVILVGTLVGLFFFREKLSVYNKIGLVLAVVSVVLIAYL